MFTTHPSVLTVTSFQAIVAASDSAEMGTQYRQCRSRSVGRQTKGAPSPLMVASTASPLLQVKTLLLTPLSSPSTKSLDPTKIERASHIKLY